MNMNMNMNMNMGEKKKHSQLALRYVGSSSPLVEIVRQEAIRAIGIIYVRAFSLPPTVDSHAPTRDRLDSDRTATHFWPDSDYLRHPSLLGPAGSKPLVHTSTSA
jgi:hypothetical protein